MDRSGSGDLDMTPAKRKAVPSCSPSGGRLAVTDAGTGAPAPAAPTSGLQRLGSGCALGCSPTMSSPVLGSWGLHSGGLGDDGDTAGCEACSGGEDAPAEGARGGKALRLCSEPAADLTGAPGSAAGQQQRPSSSHGGDGGGGLLPPGSLPPAMFRSYAHLGCCSRLSSVSSRNSMDLDAAAAAAALEDGSMGMAASFAEPGAAGGSATVPATPTGGCAPDTAVEVTAAGLAAAAASRPQPTSWPPPSAVCASSAQRVRHAWRQDEDEQMAEGGQVSYWHDIPDDILKRVLEALQPSTLRVLRLVCRGWEAAASRVLHHLRPETVVGKQLARRFPGLHTLDLSNALMGVDFATPRMLRLQSLLTDEHLAELAGLTRLEQLSLRGCSRITGLGLAQLGRLPALHMVNLSNCTGLSDECLAAVAAGVPRLATLNLQGCSRLGDEGIAHLAGMACLKHMLLPAGVTDCCMATLVDMPVLERVALRGCTRVTTTGIYMLLQRHGLQRVVISKCPQITLESLCCAGSGMELDGARLVTAEAAASAAQPAAAAAGPAAAAQAAPGVVGGHDMQLLVGDA